MKPTVETTPDDPADNLGPNALLELLDDALASDDHHFIRHALSTVARSRGLAQLAQDARITRGALSEALGEDGDPKLSIFVKILHSLGIRLTVALPPGSFREPK